MEMKTSENQEKKPGFIARKWDCVTGKAMEIVKNVKKIGKDDPRKIAHSMKFGLALTVTSLLYYFKPLYDDFGDAGMWAILTVVLIFEFTVGGTVLKGLNRGFATLVAAALGVGAEYLASLGGEKGKPIILGILVFVLATTSTFTRFLPNVKPRYDYGVMIFLLTFSLVAVSGSRVTEIVKLANERLATILIGATTCMVISIFICPVWAGQDLHNLIAGNIEKLAAFLDGFGDEFFSFPGDEGGKFASDDQEDKSFLVSYKSVLNSKASEESLANFAWWEPGRGRFMSRHPWKQYLKIGVPARECACQIEALSGCIGNSKTRVGSEFHRELQEPCTTLSTELGKALKELSSAIRNMTFPSPSIQTFIHNSKAASDDIKSMLESFSLSKHDLQEIMQLLVVASTLLDIIKTVEKISLSVQELAQKARFKKPKSLEKQQQLTHGGIINPRNDVADGNNCVVIEIHSKASELLENNNPRQLERNHKARL